jgi:hypothetical protein
VFCIDDDSLTCPYSYDLSLATTIPLVPNPQGWVRPLGTPQLAVGLWLCQVLVPPNGA